MKSKVFALLLALASMGVPISALAETPRPIFASSVYNGSGYLYIPTTTPLGNRACYFDQNSTVAASVTTGDELAFLHGVTGPIQDQINNIANGGISKLLGDVLAGPGSGTQTAALSTTGVTAGSYNNANITVDAKGRITAASNGATGGGTVSSVINLDGTVTTARTNGQVVVSINTANNNTWTGTQTFTNQLSSSQFNGPLVGNVTGNVSGSASSFTGSLAGDVTGTQSATAISASTVTGKALTGFVSGAGAVSATDSILSAIDKLDGNVSSKQPAGSYITALTGDGTASGPGSSAFTLATVAMPGTFPKVTFNAKGLVTGGSTLASGDIPNNAANTTGSAASFTGSLTGDVTGTQSATVLSTSGVTAGSYVNPSITVDAKGRITSAASGTTAVTAVTASSPLASSGGAMPNLTIQNASSTQPGALSSTDWSTFNAKQPAGSYLTALTGDVTASGPGSGAATLSSSGVTAGSYTNANITVDAKGRVTSAVNGTVSSGTVTGVSVTTANGFSGTVANPGTTPAITLSTSVNGLAKGNGTTLSAATSGTDYSAGTSGLTTGIVKSTTGTGALSIAVPADFPTLNQNTTGSAASFTGSLAGDVTGTQGATAIAASTVTGKAITGFVSGAGTVSATDSVLSAIDKLDGNIAAKQPAGSYITALTGDGTASGPGSSAFTLSTVATPGTFPKVTFNAKGLVTGGSALASGDIPNNAANTTGSAASFTGSLAGDVTGTQSATAISAGTVTGKAITGFVSGAGTVSATDSVLTAINKLDGNTNAKQPAGNYLTALTGDVTASGPGSGAATLATVTTAGTSPKVTYNAKGLVTSGSALSSADIPNNAANTTGSAASFTGSLAGDVTGTQGATILSTSGVTAGSYTSANITVDAKGRVTSAASGASSGTPIATMTTTGSIPSGQRMTVGNCSSACTLTLPALSGVYVSGQTVFYDVKVTGAGVVTVAGSGSDTIDGASTAVLKFVGTDLTVAASSTGWLIR